MPHTVKDRKKLLARIRRIKGQAEALENAILNEVDCGAILQQVASIRGAVNGLMAETLEGHVRDHLGASDVPARQRAEDVDLVVSALRSYMR